jgi:hypothetical protein
MVERHLPNRSNDIDHPSIFIEHPIEVVISHLIFDGLFIILSTIHPRQMIGHNILISKGWFQSGGWIMGALTNALFKVRNAARHFSSKSKATSF